MHAAHWHATRLPNCRPGMQACATSTESSLVNLGSRMGWGGGEGRGGCINYRNGRTLGCYKRSACVMKGFSKRLHVSSHWMGNFQLLGLAHFMESLRSYSLFSVCAVYFCFLFFWPACLRSTQYLLLGIKLFVVWFLPNIIRHVSLYIVCDCNIVNICKHWQILPTLITGNHSAIRFS